ncbi:MAG: cytochrome c1, partial [Gammaproteobacteria bacterium]|nr:cytochrome c1 [Gammaproteobacteria bacterium]
MRRLCLSLFLVAASTVASAAALPPGVKPPPLEIDLGDQESLQRGARTFINYCLSCHSAAYMRYNRMGKDLGIDEELVRDNLLFAADKVGDLMKAVMPPEDAKVWFGTAPPDLTLVARFRGPEWLYLYMTGFHREGGRWDNIVFPDVAMPHVLYEWQGEQRAVFKTMEDGSKQFDRFELVRPGSMKKEEYDAAMRDLVNF